MLKISNMGPTAFKKYIKDKTIFIYGAGRALENCLDLYFNDKQICGVVDSDKDKNGRIIRYGEFVTHIINKKELIDKIREKYDKRNILIMISSPIYGAEIVNELDRLEELDGIECFLQVLIRNTKEDYPDFEFTKAEQKIPKKIHYIWVGKNPMPYEFEKNIDSWRKYNPDYEIIRWDESNYDVNANEYTRQAYESKEWGFVPNYMRLDILYKNGGVYLDTDVEAVSNFDKLLNDDMFMCMGCADRVNNGCGFGAVAGNELLMNIMNDFSNTDFLKDGKKNKRPCHTFLHPALRDYGFKIENKYQKINGMVLYPAEVMSPLRIAGVENWITDKTVSLHKESSTWKSEKEKMASDKISELLKRVKI